MTTVTNVTGPQGPPDQKPPTYGDLELELETLVRKDIAMVRSVLKLWRQAFELTDESPLGPEFTSNYPDALAAFCEKRKVNANTKYGDKSRLGAIRKLAMQLIASVPIPGETFAERLNDSLILEGRVANEVAVAAGIAVGTMSRWRRGIGVPADPETRAKVPAIEKELGLRSGTLTRLLPVVPIASALQPDRPRLQRTALAVRIHAAMVARDYSVKGLARELGIKSMVLAGWLKPGGFFPGRVHRENTLKPLGDLLGIPLDDLLSLLPPLPNTQLPFHSGAFTPEQQREWDAFKNHKIDKLGDHLPEDYWRVKQDGSCPTEQMVLSSFRGFWGWLTQVPSTEAREGSDDIRTNFHRTPDTVRLVDCLRLDVVVEYVRWHASQRTARGTTAVYTGSHAKFIKTVMSLVRKKTGYYWHGHTVDFADVAARGIATGAGGGAPTLKEWRKHCKKVRKQLKKFLDKLETHGLAVRDARAHIEGFVSQDRPGDFLDIMVSGLAEDFDRFVKMKASSYRLAVLSRDLLFLSLICDVPMRLGQWQFLTYKADNTGHLRRAPEGKPYDYVLHIPQEEMKSPKIGDPPFEAPIDRAHTPLIERYLIGTASQVPDRAYLADGKDPKCHYVFRPASVGINDGRREPYAFLANRVLHWSETYLTDHLVKNRGFRTHALRHIIATHFVKKYGDPVGVMMASQVLANRPEMIRAHYGFLTSMEQNTKALILVQEERRLGRELRKNNSEAAA